MTENFPPEPMFAVPHAFFDLITDGYSIAERLFYITLRKLMAGHESEAWVLLLDAPGATACEMGKTFACYGLSARACKSARKKLVRDGLIATRYARNRKGHRIGTEYRLVDEGFARLPKAVHQAILGRSGALEVNGGLEREHRTLEDFSGPFGAPTGGDSPGLDF